MLLNLTIGRNFPETPIDIRYSCRISLRNPQPYFGIALSVHKDNRLVREIAYTYFSRVNSFRSVTEGDVPF